MRLVILLELLEATPIPEGDVALIREHFWATVIIGAMRIRSRRIKQKLRENRAKTAKRPLLNPP